VAVHGLGGDSIKTWTHPKSNVFWLRDFLPQQIPDARIMTFGYNAAAAFGQSTSDVIDHAKSLLGSLVDKREGLGVPVTYSLQDTVQELTVRPGQRSPSHIHRTFSRRNCSETRKTTLECTWKELATNQCHRLCYKRALNHAIKRSAMSH
jgi:hypothetical protein